jgi:uncharacterized protein YbbK (DUF523 family)
VADGIGVASGDRGSSGPVLLVSACLLGVACTHDGTARPSEALLALRSAHGARLVPVCPETAGGLPTPRPAAERSASDGRVRTSSGADVTVAYERGADHAVRLARTTGATGAVLKARSPSCGCREVYDGSFTRTRVAGEGVTAERLRLEGLEVCSEEELSGWEPARG